MQRLWRSSVHWSLTARRCQHQLAWLQIPSGILSVLTMLGALFTGLTLLEDLESEASSEKGPQAQPA